MAWAAATSFPGLNPGTKKVTIVAGDRVLVNTDIANSIETLELIGSSAADPNGLARVRWESAFTLNVSGNLNISFGRIASLAPVGTLNVSGNFQVTNVVQVREVNFTITGTTTINASASLSFDNYLASSKKFKGLVTNNGTWNNAVNYPVEFQGGFINYGTFTSGTGTYSLTTNSQDLGGTNPLTITNLQINTPGTISLLTNNVTVSGTLTMSSGNINGGGSTLIISNNAPGALVYTSGIIIGKFQRAISNAGLPKTYLYPIGTSTEYRPVSLKFNNVTTAGSLSE